MRYLSKRRQNYNSESETCIYSDTFSKNCFFCETIKSWVKCNSDYCNIHGVKNRRKKSDTLKSNFPHIGLWYGVSLHFGKNDNYKLHQAVYNEFVRRLKSNFPELAIKKVTHWKYGIRHFHIMLGWEYYLDRRFVRSQLSAALNKDKGHELRVRMGWRTNMNNDKMLSYYWRIKGRLPEDEFPPGWLSRWEYGRV